MKYGIVQTLAPGTGPVSIEEAANYVRADAVEDLQGLQTALDQATEHASKMTGRAMLASTYRLALPSWPSWDLRYGRSERGSREERTIEIPRSPLLTVTSVKYYDENNADATLPTASYLVVTDIEPGMVYLKEGYDWPDLYDRPDAVRITFTAGYASVAVVPPQVRQAILLLTRYFYAGGNPNQHTDRVSDWEAANRVLLAQRVDGWIS